MREFIAIIFLSISGSKLFWYDFRTIVSDGRIELLSQSFLIYSVSLLPFILYFIYSQYYTLVKQKLILYIFAVNLYGLLLAITLGECNIFLIQDVYKFLFIPAGFGLASFLYRRGCDIERVLRITIIVMSLFALARLTVHATLKDGGMIFGTVHDVILIGYSIVELLSGKSILGFLGGLVVLPSVLVGQKRTLVLIAFILIIIYLLKIINEKKGRVIVRALLSIMLFVGGGYVVSSYVDYNYKRVQSTFDTFDTDVGVDSKRLREVKVAYQEIRNNSDLAFITGLGSGAYFVDPVHNPVSGEILVHSIHVTPVAMIFRYGIVGAVLYVAIILSIFVLLYVNRQGISGVSNKMFFVILSYLIGSVIMSFTIYGLVDDIFIGFFIGILWFSWKCKFNMCVRRMVNP